MNVAIFGIVPLSQIVANVIELNYNTWIKQRLGEPLNVVAFIDVFKKDDAPKVINDIVVLDDLQFVALYRKKAIEKIIFPRDVFSHWIREYMMVFGKLNVRLEDIYLTAILRKLQIEASDFFEPYTSAKYLPYLEFHIADHCNLNCKACAHYSGLVRQPTFYKLETFKKDLEQLHKFIDDIAVIRIMGGEPLLNPNINEYIKFTRKIYPTADLHVVTNATLLPKMPEDFFKTLRNCDVTVDISVYPPMKNKIQYIIDFLQERQIKISINLNKFIEEFQQCTTTQKHDHGKEIFYGCGMSKCNFLLEGKIAVCPATATTKYFNAYYGMNLPTDGMIDLYEEGLTTEKIKKILLTPFERCNYCTEPNFITWDTIKHPSPISDWVTDGLPVCEKLFDS